MINNFFDFIPRLGFKCMYGKVFTIEKTAVVASIIVETDTKKFDQHNPKANKCMLPETYTVYSSILHQTTIYNRSKLWECSQKPISFSNNGGLARNIQCISKR